MNLLAEIYSQEEMIPKTFGTLESKVKPELDLNEIDLTDDSEEGMGSLENPYMLSTLAPRLWPFMRHSITSVRLSAIRTLVLCIALLFIIFISIYFFCDLQWEFPPLFCFLLDDLLNLLLSIIKL